MSAPLNAKLNSVKWGEFKVSDLFNVQKVKNMLSKEDTVDNGKYPVYSSDSTNNGVIGYTKHPEFICTKGNPVYIIFGDHTRTFNIAQSSFSVLDNVKVLSPSSDCTNNIRVLLFIISIWKLLIPSLGYSRHWKIAKSCTLYLPVNQNNKINIVFMESFIRELEEERIRELSAYLKASGLNDTNLTIEEHNALRMLNSMSWSEYNVPNVFEVKNTRNINSSSITENSGTTPYLCASAFNNGVSSYILYDESMMDKGNCIFIGGKTFVVSYQEKDFFSNDSHNLALYCKDIPRKKLNQLFLVTCVNKSLGHKYTWGDSISKTKIKNDKILLPSTDGHLDYSMMETVIRAVQKLVIKDVVDYTNKKLEATKYVVVNT